MNVFEDLVVELKEENLLEDTIMDGKSFEIGLGDPIQGNRSRFTVSGSQRGSISREKAAAETEARRPNSVSNPSRRPVLFAPSQDPVRFHKRCTELVAVFQIVQHVLAAVENQAQRPQREKYDDLQVNKTLHRLSQNLIDPSTAEFAEAKAAIMAELRTWQDSLSKRDSEVSVALLRKYCEACQPPLSSQALFALARFYYELPTTDESQCKFDFVLTKLFTRPDSEGKRQLICPRSEIVGHLHSRFVEWFRPSATGQNDAESLVNSMSCEDFIKEIENASEISDLISSDFFHRIREFKESTGDHFFTTQVAASVIECNVRIGNQLVDLLRIENSRFGPEQIKERYGFLERDSFESTANRTFDLEEVLREAASKRQAKERKSGGMPSAIDSSLVEHRVEPKIDEKPTQRLETTRRGLLESVGVNKWLVIVGALAIAASIGLYIWADQAVVETSVNNGVKAVDLEKSSFKEFIKDGRISSETFYGVTTVSWDQLKKEQKEELLGKILRDGADKGYKKVSLINQQAKQVGFASSRRIEATDPQ